MVEGHELRRLQAILDGDGSEIREQFIYAELLLTVFERFKDYIVGRVDGFFSDQVEIRDGELRHKRGERFKQLMKEKGAGLPGQHANKAFRAALHWFLSWVRFLGRSSTMSSAFTSCATTLGMNYFASWQTTKRLRLHWKTC